VITTKPGCCRRNEGKKQHVAEKLRRKDGKNASKDDEVQKITTEPEAKAEEPAEEKKPEKEKKAKK